MCKLLYYYIIAPFNLVSYKFGSTYGNVQTIYKHYKCIPSTLHQKKCEFNAHKVQKLMIRNQRNGLKICSCPTLPLGWKTLKLLELWFTPRLLNASSYPPSIMHLFTTLSFNTFSRHLKMNMCTPSMINTFARCYLSYP
jgi:hypothetical protein